MGRRKIEIKSIKDDRNRSVTFLKRKGGLFKKAHELSVLCSVDVAVIIFGTNKKLYEFSSGDIHETLRRYHYVGAPHEHKGPQDFAGKDGSGGAGDDDDEDDGGTPPPEEPTPPMMHPQFQNQPNLQHMRQHTPSNSPPIPNGMFHQRLGTPQPQMGSRPASRQHMRRQSSGLVALPTNQQQPQQQGPGPYNYPPDQQFYQQQHPQYAQQPHHHGQPGMPQHSQMQQVYMQDQRRQSLPPNFQQAQSQPLPAMHTPPLPTPPHTQQSLQQHAQQAPQHAHQQQHQQHPQPQHTDHTQGQGAQHVVPVQQLPQHQRAFQSPPLPEPRALPNTSKPLISMFTPIDDKNSLLARPWGASGYPDAQVAGGASHADGGRSQSSGSMARPDDQSATDVQSRQRQHPARTASSSTIGDIPAPHRTDSIQSNTKKPSLKVLIPNEEQDESSVVEGSSSRHSGDAEATPIKSKGVVLPPPSPSASALLSAGASGPKNPFARARPPPPTSGINNGNSFGREMDTPMSALPSRFMSDNLLPSPSSFYPEWGFGRGNDSATILPSPIQYHQTPAVANGPSFRDEDPDRKRKTSADEGEGAAGKRVRSEA